jgi:hypothetical protein
VTGLCWRLRVALVATLVLTASGEFVFATRVGWPPYVAWALAVSLDVYVVVALEARRDVAWAIGLMAATNIAAHSVEMIPGLMVGQGADRHPVWWLVAAASALPPVVLWRIHRLSAATRIVSGHHEDGVTNGGDQTRDQGAISHPRPTLVTPATNTATTPGGHARSQAATSPAASTVTRRVNKPATRPVTTGATKRATKKRDRSPSLTWDEALSRGRALAGEQDGVPSVRSLIAVPGMGSRKAREIHRALVLEHQSGADTQRPQLHLAGQHQA